MTALLTGLLVLVGAVALLNLLLTVGVIRRLRQHTEQLSTAGGFGGPAPAVMLEAGARAEDFAATTTDGEPVSRELLSGQTLVGVFTPGCGACEERLPEFLDRATAFPGGRSQVLAVVAGEAEAVRPYRDKLAPVARVVVEPPMNGTLTTALKVQGFPAFGLIAADGTVVASALTLAELPLVSPVAA